MNSADPSGYEILMLSLEDYEQVRAHPSRFLLVAGQKTKRPHRSESSKPRRATRSSRRWAQRGEEAARLNPRVADAD